jgi:hypothetical protein
MVLTDLPQPPSTTVGVDTMPKPTTMTMTRRSIYSMVLTSTAGAHSKHDDLGKGEGEQEESYLSSRVISDRVID